LNNSSDHLELLMSEPWHHVALGLRLVVEQKPMSAINGCAVDRTLCAVSLNIIPTPRTHRKWHSGF